MARTALLDRTTWDFCLDASGNIAVASPPYALAQDAASAIRLFLGEAWYDTTRGVPYFQQVLGQYPSVQALKALFVAAALTVPGVVSAVVFLTDFDLSSRRLSGQVQIADAAGTVMAAGF